MLFAQVPRPKSGTRWVIADIHGCYRTFENLVLEKLQISPLDHLYLLGDYIDRGPDSARVLDFILELENNQFQVFPLRGNHEQDLLEDWEHYQESKTRKDLKAFVEHREKQNTASLLDERGNLRTSYYYFLKDLPYYYELPDYYLVHAGFNFNAPQPFADFESMIWSRNLLKKKRSIPGLSGNAIVIGHTVESLKYIQKRIEEKNQIIALDNGCFYAYIYQDEPAVYQESGIGNLCAFNLDTRELVVQPCLDR